MLQSTGICYKKFRLQNQKNRKDQSVQFHYLRSNLTFISFLLSFRCKTKESRKANLTFKYVVYYIPQLAQYNSSKQGKLYKYKNQPQISNHLATLFSDISISTTQRTNAGYERAIALQLNKQKQSPPCKSYSKGMNHNIIYCKFLI
jgi:hypothetical protein